MELEHKSSGVAKAGLTTGIIGTSLGALSALGGGLLANRAAVASAVESNCNEDHLVNRYELEQQKKISDLETQIALRDANTYNDQKSLEMYKYIDSQFNALQAQLSAQAVKNQSTADSFQMVSERMACMNQNLETQIANERHERKCADNTIVTYSNATFYPKQVADVTTGSTTTAQTLYNPLPAESCNCGY